MATKTESRSKGESKSRKGGDKSAFNWGDNNAGVLIGAAAAGAMLGFAANMGRKMFMQGMTSSAGDWADALAAEHEMALAIFDKMEATSDDQTTMRSTLLAKLKYALTKHALEEENVIYPALRQANSPHDADTLEGEHGYVKTYLYELENMPKDSPEWLARVRDFRSMIEEHMRMEEDEVFPALKSQMSEDQNKKLTAMMNKEGLKFA